MPYVLLLRIAQHLTSLCHDSRENYGIMRQRTENRFIRADYAGGRPESGRLRVEDSSEDRSEDSDVHQRGREKLAIFKLLRISCKCLSTHMPGVYHETEVDRKNDSVFEVHTCIERAWK